MENPEEGWWLVLARLSEDSVRVDASMVDAHSRVVQGESDWMVSSAEDLIEYDSFPRVFVNIVDLVISLWTNLLCHDKLRVLNFRVCVYGMEQICTAAPACLPAAQYYDAGIDGVDLGLIRYHEKLAK